ncbi:chloride channel protein [Rhizosphaericola mali]|uniref:Voltage-gated chloride channel protein n=1 Tax=Rhizosphaericola mali TaxID=2545455 RepID=A0A5P2FXN8_9BACT|nr:chloride channel protein [Rhizosphaericola mali]QES87158.1 voltage-gated chloride channel protein [Rhizosphaericola mali]
MQIFSFKKFLKEQFILLSLSAIVGILSALFIAFFLKLLEAATAYRNSHFQLLFLLPIAGWVIYLSYQYLGKNSSKGNNLIIKEAKGNQESVPAVMLPLVLFGTVITHLFGGSAGREGTAVQIGGTVAAKISEWCKLNQQLRSILLICGIGAGFSAVFGTPLTGFVFSLEVLVIGKMEYKAAPYSLIASLIANYFCLQLGIHHTKYFITSSIPMNGEWISIALKVGIASIGFGLAGYLFSYFIELFKKIYSKILPKAWMIPIFGGIIIIILGQWLVGKDYLGLGVDPNYPGAASIVGAFHAGGSFTWSWFWKLLFTTITLSAGFKGGEVTPLFFIGAALGNTLATLFNIPIDLLAGVGFIAVFAAATNTPLACTMMGIELFGAANLPFFAIGCFVAYYCSGHSGIYTSQNIGIAKNSFLQIRNNKLLSQHLSQKELFYHKKWTLVKNKYL